MWTKLSQFPKTKFSSILCYFLFLKSFTINHKIHITNVKFPLHNSDRKTQLFFFKSHIHAVEMHHLKKHMW